MDFKNVGSTQLLQDLLKQQLIGSICYATSADDQGWICVTFFPSENVFSMDERSIERELLIHRRMALPFISWMLVLVREGELIRGDATTASAPVFTVRGGKGDDPLVCSWAADSQSVQVRREGEQLELTIAAGAGRRLAADMVERLAQNQIDNRRRLGLAGQ